MFFLFTVDIHSSVARKENLDQACVRSFRSSRIALSRTPLSRSSSSAMMRPNVVLQPSDTRRLSPQTTSSSGYHSDLSSSNESPQSIHDAAVVVAGESASPDRRTTTDRKSSANKNLARLSTFFRQQYERAKSKLLPSRASIPSVSTCSKATSITPVSPYANSNYATSPAPYASSAAYTYSSFVEPVSLHSMGKPISPPH